VKRLARVVVTVPTYNEAENIGRLLGELLALPGTCQVLVVDDDSPDGTWRIVADLAAREPRVSVLRRTEDRGRGAAGREGFRRALAMGAEIVVEMDADFSHQPRFVPALVAVVAGGADVAIGSRAAPGGSDVGRPLWRRLVTGAANRYIRIVLGMKVRDCNSGFRCFSRGALLAIGVDRIRSRGPGIVQEVLFKAHRAGLAIAEIPIEFVERERGTSTLTMRTLLRGYFLVLELRWRAWTGRL
jgi:glycosyltransferase involved in cell wall biosynthesis